MEPNEELVMLREQVMRLRPYREMLDLFLQSECLGQACGQPAEELRRLIDAKVRQALEFRGTINQRAARLARIDAWIFEAMDFHPNRGVSALVADRIDKLYRVAPTALQALPDVMCEFCGARRIAGVWHADLILPPDRAQLEALQVAK